MKVTALLAIVGASMIPQVLAAPAEVVDIEARDLSVYVCEGASVVFFHDLCFHGLPFFVDLTGIGLDVVLTTSQPGIYAHLFQPLG